MRKDEYLWDKSGSDAEIEELENALSVFRYRETAPPKLVADVVPFPAKRAVVYGRSLYAMAACVLAAAILAAVWFGSARTQQDLEQSSVPVSTAPVNDPQPAFPRPEPADVVIAPEPPPRHVAVRASQNTPRRIRPVKAVLRSKKPVKLENLTADERYAYNQLMLALEITGSKLRLVSDKVQSP